MEGLPGGLKYVGLTAFVLAIFSIARTNRRVAPLVLTCGGCAVLILLKVYGVRPVQWIALLPGFQNVHYAHYLGIPLAFLISILSGVGLDHLRRKAIPGWLIGMAAVVLAALLISLWFFMRSAGNFAQPGAGRWTAAFCVAALLGLVAIAESVLAYRAHGGFWGRAACWTLLALVLFEGIWNATYPRQRRWDAFTHLPPYVSFLEKMPPGSRGLQVELFRANSGSAFGIDQLDSLYAFFSSRMFQLYVTYVGSTDPLFMRGGSKIPPEPVLDRAGINWVMINPFLPAMISELDGRNYPAIYDRNGLKIFGRPAARRQIFSSEYEVLDPAAALQSIATAPSNIVVLEAAPPVPSSPNRVDDPGARGRLGKTQLPRIPPPCSEARPPLRRRCLGQRLVRHREWKGGTDLDRKLRLPRGRHSRRRGARPVLVSAGRTDSRPGGFRSLDRDYDRTSISPEGQDPGRGSRLKLDRNRRLDRGMRIVVFEREILETKIADLFHARDLSASAASGRNSRDNCSRACSR